eukprot:TRINITY_DN5634_c0_g1_i1.p1 TRINITY_DN5634_c0_g1~~TRINITY_DN5634_c0_g1_i1.p1  ORF type:complete len:138 (-),score=14.65 TRINITY_DN5634_c0_g1_i1:66-479(-)
MDYIFSHFCGIFITSTGYFLIYCLLKKNKPYINPEVVLPAFISGLMWAIADICWFISNADPKVGLVVSFPVVSTLPGLVGSMWGILVYREITGRRNYIFFGIAFFLVVTSVTCVTLSQALGGSDNTTHTNTTHNSTF